MEKLIESVRKYPCLWKIDSQEYKLNDLKEAAWQEVVKECDLKDGTYNLLYYNYYKIFVLNLKQFLILTIRRWVGYIAVACIGSLIRVGIDMKNLI